MAEHHRLLIWNKSHRFSQRFKKIIEERKYDLVEINKEHDLVLNEGNSLILAEIKQQKDFNLFLNDTRMLSRRVPILLISSVNLSDSRIGKDFHVLKQTVSDLDFIIELEKCFLEDSHFRDLRQYESGFKELIENIDEAIYYLDGKGSIKYISPGVSRINGFLSDELIGRNVFDFIYPDDKLMARRFFRKALDNKSSLNEIRIKHKSREYCWVRLNLQIHRVDDRFLGMTGILNNIDSEKKALADLKNTEAKYRYLVETSHDLIWSLDTEGQFSYINDSACRRIMGYTADEIKQLYLRDLVAPELKKSNQIIFNDVLKGRNLFNHETVFISKSGDRILLKINARAEIAEDGELLGISGSASDISDLKKAQKSILELNQILERKVEKQSLELEDSENLYRTLVETIPDAVIVTNITGHCSYASPGALDIFRVDDFEQIRGKQILQSVDPEKFDYYSWLFERILEEKVVKNIEVRLSRDDGSWFDASVSAALLRRNENEASGIIFSARDISYLKRMEYISDSTLKLFRQMSDYSSEELINHGLEECVRITNSEIGFFHWINDDRSWVEMITWSKDIARKRHSEENKLNHPVPDTTLWNDFLNSQKPLIVNDYELDSGKMDIPDGHFSISRFMTIPIIEGDSVKAILGVVNKAVDYTEIDERQASLFVRNIWSLVQRNHAETKLLRLNAQLKDMNTRLEELARIDSLTGLYNRRYLNERLHSFLKSCSRDQMPLGLIMIDIDHFKAYNDHYGHLPGDEILVKIAEAIKAALLRPGDMAARYGGEEFIIVMPDTDTHGAVNVAERIASSIKDLAIEHKASSLSSKRLTVSQGIHSAIPRGIEKLSTILDRADTALYEAKETGRDRICIYRKP